MRISLVLSIFGLAVGVDPSSALRSTRPKTPKTGFRKKPIVLPKTLKTGFRNSKRPNVLTMDVASSSSSLPEPPATTSRYKSYTDSLDVNSLPNFSILPPPLPIRFDNPVLRHDSGYKVPSDEELDRLFLKGKQSKERIKAAKEGGMQMKDGPGLPRPSQPEH